MANRANGPANSFRTSLRKSIASASSDMVTDEKMKSEGFGCEIPLIGSAFS
jgi:hypothetical protein